MPTTIARQASSSHFRQRTDQFRGPILVALIYLLGAEAAFLIGTLSDKIFALFWPPNVILFCALLVVPQRDWWRYIAAAFPAHVIAELGVGMPVPQLLVAFATNCVVALLNAYAVRRYVGGPPWFRNFRKSSIYIAITAGFAPALSALGGAFVPIMGGGAVEDYWIYWSLWYLANVLPNLTLGPVFMIWFSDEVRWSARRPTWRHVEFLILAVVLVAACVMAVPLSERVSPTFALHMRLLALPIVLWAAIRFGERGASSAILIVSVVLTWSTLRGSGLLPGVSPERSVLALQLFLIGLAIPMLLLGALIDELQQTGRTMRSLAVSLLRAQDEERRRIARDLHDSTGQNLVAATWIVARIENTLPIQSRPLLRELDELLRTSMQEVRTVSYVLHPPLLDEMGLEPALRSFIDGYMKRTGVAVDVDIAPDLERPEAETELVLFRLVQEALINVARHSNSPIAQVRLFCEHTARGQNIMLTISDAGQGMPQLRSVDRRHHRPTSSGVGLASMRERLRQVGGRLEIDSKVGRTTLTAIVPT